MEYSPAHIHEDPYSAKIAKLQRLERGHKQLVNTLLQYEGSFSTPPSVTGYDSYIVIRIYSIKDLSVARAVLTDVLQGEKWKDSLTQIWDSGLGKNMLVSWENDPPHPQDYQIWLSTTIDSFPKELFPSPDCVFERQSSGEHYTLVCPNK